MRALIKYYSHIYFKSGKFAVPFIAWSLAVLVVFQDGLGMLIDNTGLLLSVLFVVMTAVGYLYMDEEKNMVVADQIMLFHTRSAGYFNLSKNIFLLLLATFMSVYGSGLALLTCITKKGTILWSSVSVSHFLLFFLGLLLSALLGVALGAFLHPRIIKNRTLSATLLIATLLLTFVKGALVDTWGFLRYVMWIFPPINDLLVFFGDRYILSGINLLLTALHSVIFIAMVVGFQLMLLHKNKY